MQFVPLAGGLLDLPVLDNLKVKVGTYAVLVDDLFQAGKRAVYAVKSTFRAARKVMEALQGSKQGTLYAYTGFVELASQWQGVVWAKNPRFNGQ